MDSFEIHYAPTVALAIAQAELREELPPDAKLVFLVRKGECELRQYKSRALARLEGPVRLTEKQKKFEALFGKQVQGLIDAAFYSSETAPYNGNTVESIVLLPGYNAQDRTHGC